MAGVKCDRCGRVEVAEWMTATSGGMLCPDCRNATWEEQKRKADSARAQAHAPSEKVDVERATTKLAECPACGIRVSTEAASCPSCGHPIRKGPPDQCLYCAGSLTAATVGGGGCGWFIVGLFLAPVGIGFIIMIAALMFWEPGQALWVCDKCGAKFPR